MMVKQMMHPWQPRRVRMVHSERQCGGISPSRIRPRGLDGSSPTSLHPSETTVEKNKKEKDHFDESNERRAKRKRKKFSFRRLT